MATTQSLDTSTLHRPRILCLHGGGTNALILRLQARTYIPLLAPHYRLVFADAPFTCAPHPAIVPVYSDFGPFRLWNRWRSDQAVCGGGDESKEGETVLQEWEQCLREAMDEDDAAGGTGEWVGLFGFSQGARVAGSILLESQIRREALRDGNPWGYSVPVPEGFAGGKWQFGVLLAGRGPFIGISDEGRRIPGVDQPGGLVTTTELRPGEASDWKGPRVGASTVHVHGLKDSGNEFHKQYEEFDFVEGSTRRIVWDGDHRLAYKVSDVTHVVKAIIDIGKELGILDAYA